VFLRSSWGHAGNRVRQGGQRPCRPARDWPGRTSWSV